MAVKLGNDDIERTNREFADAFTPPGWVYRDEALFARELREIFASNWLCIGHSGRLANPGDYFLINTGADSIIIAADTDGEARAFHNVCRHRGTRLLSETSGTLRSIRCPYHAWNYALDGRLMTAPGMNEVKGFKKSDYPLNPVRLEKFNGFLFVNLDTQARPLADVYADFPDMTRFGTDDLVRVAYRDYQVACNWKLICENYNECYHCPGAHPQVHRISAHIGDGCHFDHHTGEHFTGGPMTLRPGFNTMNIEGLSTGPNLPGATKTDERLVYYFNLFPGMLYTIAPDYVLTHYVWPTGPQSCYIETEWFCAPGQSEDPGVDLASAIEFWHGTNKQDWELCETAMRGLRSQGHLPGRYHPEESCVHDFDRWYVRTMFDTPHRGSSFQPR